jgi:hypothetical protein
LFTRDEPRLYVAGALVCSFVLAYLTYALVEREIRFGKRSPARRLGTAVAMLLAPGLIGVAVMLGAVRVRLDVAKWNRYDDARYEKPFATAGREIATMVIRSSSPGSWARIAA